MDITVTLLKVPNQLQIRARARNQSAEISGFQIRLDQLVARVSANSAQGNIQFS